MKRVRVRVAETARDGVLFKWKDSAGVSHQRSYEGTRTRNRIDDARSELEDELNRRGSCVDWESFKKRYTSLHLEQNLAPRSQEKYRTMLRRFDEMLARRGIKRLACSDLTTEMILDVQDATASEVASASSVDSCMSTMWAIINWGIDFEILPEIRRPRKRKGKRQQKHRSRGRSLTLEEIERMCQAIRDNPIVPGQEFTVRQTDEEADRFIRAIHAMRLIGLRVGDCHLLHWEPRDGCHYPLNLDGRFPLIVIADEQKSGLEQEIPLVPAAVEWLKSLSDREGWICRARGRRGFHQTPNRLGRVIARAGCAAGIVTKRTGARGGGPKTASAHDLRRTFATEWLGKLSIKEVQTLTRHADVNTLLTYYADCDVPQLARRLKSANEKSGGYLVDEHSGQ